MVPCAGILEWEVRAHRVELFAVLSDDAHTHDVEADPVVLELCVDPIAHSCHSISGPCGRPRTLVGEVMSSVSSQRALTPAPSEASPIDGSAAGPPGRRSGCGSLSAPSGHRHRFERSRVHTEASVGVQPRENGSLRAEVRLRRWRPRRARGKLDAMPGLYGDEFVGYRIPTDDEVNVALRGGVVALDANVLLGLYRFLPQTANDLIKVLGRLEDRLVVPNQALREFWRHRQRAAGSPEAAMRVADDAIGKAVASAASA